MGIITGQPVNPRISKASLDTCLRLTLSFSLASCLLPSESFGWAEPITANVTTIKASHIVELRTTVNSKLAVCLQPAQAWTHGTLTPRSTTIKKTDLDELRTATTNLVNAYQIQQALPPSPPAYTDAIVARTTPIKAVHFNELRTIITATTCTVNCPAQALGWTVGPDSCSTSAPVTPVLTAANVTDSVGATTGSAQFNCGAGGVWAATPNAGATCSGGPPPCTLGSGSTMMGPFGRCWTSFVGSAMGMDCKESYPECPCTAQPLNWTIGAQSCTAPAPVTLAGAAAFVVDSIAVSMGSAQFQCLSYGNWRATPEAGATCGPIVSGCGPGINWDTGTAGYSGGGNCYGAITGPVVDNGPPGAPVVVTNSAPGFTGTATARCHDSDPVLGTVAAEWIVSGATCNVASTGVWTNIGVGYCALDFAGCPRPGNSATEGAACDPVTEWWICKGASAGIYCRELDCM